MVRRHVFFEAAQFLARLLALTQPASARVKFGDQARLRYASQADAQSSSDLACRYRSLALAVANRDAYGLEPCEIVIPTVPRYSARNASTGSIVVALRAGR